MGVNRIEVLELYLQEDPQDAFTRYALALEYLKIGKEIRGLELLEEVRNKNPEYLALYYQLGKLYQKLNRLEDAINCFDEGIKLSLKHKNLHTRSELQQALSELKEEEE